GRARRDNGVPVLCKIGQLAVRRSRPLVGTPRTATVSHKAAGWQVSFSCAEAPTEPPPPTGCEARLKLIPLAAEGRAVEKPRHYRKAEKALVKAQQRLSRRKKCSKRWWKGARLVAKQHPKERPQWRDFHHTTALILVRQYAVRYLEDLRVA